jgi:hypothetical protein
VWRKVTDLGLEGKGRTGVDRKRVGTRVATCEAYDTISVSVSC